MEKFTMEEMEEHWGYSIATYLLELLNDEYSLEELKKDLKSFRPSEE